MRRITRPAIASHSPNHLTAVLALSTVVAASAGCVATPDKNAVVIPASRIDYYTATLSTPVDLPPLLKPPVAHPDYPDYAMRHPKPGMVLLKIDVDVTGRVTSVEVIESTNILLESSARQAALQWSFEPAQRSGRPVAATIVVPVEFTQGEH
ncbi:MAG: energy transducer TonB [Nitrospirota bacterium]